MEFSDQYKHPKWQAKRLEIMRRDKFKCRLCDSEDKQLHVHHRYYKRAVKLWEYKNTCYLTTCNRCHEYLHQVQDELNHKLSLVDPMHLECFAKSDLKKLSRMLVNGELDAVKKYIKTLKYHG